MSAIIGVLVVAATLVIRLGQPLTVSVAPPLDLRAVAAGSIAAPEGEAIVAAGAAQGALILVTRDAEGAERLHLYDAASEISSLEGRLQAIFAITARASELSFVNFLR